MNCEDVNVEDVDVEEVNDEDANCKDVTFEDVDVENCDDADDYEESDESDDSDDSDECNLGPDVGVDWTTVLPNDSAEKISRKNDISDVESCDSDELYTPPASDDEGDMVRFPKFKETAKFEIGMMFKDKMQTRDAVKEYALENKKNLVFKKNDKKRMVAKCMDGCPFHLRFSMRKANQSWQLVSFTDQHNCHRTIRNRQAKTDWLARKFVYILRHTPELKTKGLIAIGIA